MENGKEVSQKKQQWEYIGSSNLITHMSKGNEISMLFLICNVCRTIHPCLSLCLHCCDKILTESNIGEQRVIWLTDYSQSIVTEYQDRNQGRRPWKRLAYYLTLHAFSSLLSWQTVLLFIHSLGPLP